MGVGVGGSTHLLDHQNHHHHNHHHNYHHTTGDCTAEKAATQTATAATTVLTKLFGDRKIVRRMTGIHDRPTAANHHHNHD